MQYIRPQIGDGNVYANVKVNPTWNDPAILWSIVAANMGKKDGCTGHWTLGGWIMASKQQYQQKIRHATTDNFNFAELHYVLKGNGFQSVGLCDEMSTLASTNSWAWTSNLDLSSFLMVEVHGHVTSTAYPLIVITEMRLWTPSKHTTIFLIPGRVSRIITTFRESYPRLAALYSSAKHAVLYLSKQLISHKNTIKTTITRKRNGQMGSQKYALSMRLLPQSWTPSYTGWIVSTLCMRNEYT